MKKVKLLLAAIGLWGLAGCGGSGSTAYFTHTWYTVYGSSCGNLKPGCTYVDWFTSAKAQWWDDPSYSMFRSPEWAIVFDTDLGFYVDAFGYWGFNGVFYDYYSERAINEGAGEVSRDVLAIEGNREEDMIEVAGKDYAKRYQLADETGMRVARVMNDWNKIGKSRSRTDADVADFTQRLYGVDLNEVNSAFTEGDQASQEELLSKAAQTWNTSAENMRKILSHTYQAVNQ
ncbi:MAG: hypothetical protein COT74_03410 [Bdellovibrionales bacterium CG10_big_fil_rev_8_21_14_0_10_45_34]|nr:MAG: hypothetical protein COT74_03410 [Bdellovibrionales bacterium CG10_big_fil_rev_8_21_14_0_10_45_34]